MHDRTLYVILLDYYGKLLSEKQLSAMVSYFYEDFSLNEIADNLGVTKQAISSLINRSCKKLLEYEEVVGFLKKTQDLKDSISDIIEKVDDNPDIGVGKIKEDLIKLKTSLIKEV